MLITAINDLNVCLYPFRLIMEVPGTPIGDYFFKFENAILEPTSPLIPLIMGCNLLKMTPKMKMTSMYLAQPLVRTSSQEIQYQLKLFQLGYLLVLIVNPLGQGLTSSLLYFPITRTRTTTLTQILIEGMVLQVWYRMEDDLQWKTTFNGRQPSIEDDLRW